MKHPGLWTPGLPKFRARVFSWAFSGLAIFRAYFWASVYFQSQDPHDLIVQPDPSKESRTISQTGLASDANDSAEPQNVQNLVTQL